MLPHLLGHSNCDGVDPDVGLEDPTDCRFTYDDSRVRETSGDYVCDRQKETAYILSYRRQVRDTHCKVHSG